MKTNEKELVWYKRFGKWIKEHKDEVIFVSGIACGVSLTIYGSKELKKYNDRKIDSARIFIKRIGNDKIGIKIGPVYKNGKVNYTSGIILDNPAAQDISDYISELVSRSSKEM